MNQAMEDQLKILLDGPVATLGGRCLAHLVVNGLITRGLAEATQIGTKPAAMITRKGCEVLQRIRCEGRR